MTKTQKYDDVVFLATDAAYLPTAWIAARSAAAQPNRNFDVMLLVEHGACPPGLPPPPGCDMRQITLPPETAAWTSANHMSRCAYARLAAPDLWLQGYRRALYLDADIAITGALAPLLALDLHGATVAMATDCSQYLRNTTETAAWHETRQQLGQNPDAPYFNSGVILFDLARWTAQSCWPRARDFLTSHGDAAKFMDQDALNAVTAGAVQEISPRWNYPTHYLGLAAQSVIAPRIIHYLDILKPWRDPEWRQLYNPTYAANFAAAFTHSPWPNYVPPALYRAPSPLWPHWRRARAALAGKPPRRLSTETLAGHVAHYKSMQPALEQRIARGLMESLDRGCFADLTAAETTSWRLALQRL